VASDDVAVVVIGPAIRAVVDANFRRIYAGEEVTFRYTVQNVGDCDLTGVTVTDTFATSISAPGTLAVGDPAVFWDVRRRLYETTLVELGVTGLDPLNDPVSDRDGVKIEVVEALQEVDIVEPVLEDSTVVTGTAEPGRVLSIRDLMDPSFSIADTVVRADGTYRFANLPALVAGHVIVVEGYGEADSAVVRPAGPVEAIALYEPLCQEQTDIRGVAEPGKEVLLLVSGLGYEDLTTVDAGGQFTFTLAGGLTLQAGQTVEVSGYGLRDSVVVSPCTDIYITVAPQCGQVGGETPVVVSGYNWRYQNKMSDITIQFDGTTVGVWDAETDGQLPQWEKTVTLVAAEGVHEITAQNDVVPRKTTTFIAPCPSPNLVVTDLELLTTGVISTYQPLTFQMLVANVGARPVNRLFWTDLYGSGTHTDTLGWAAVSSLPAGDSIPLTVTVQNGLPTTGTYSVWALADSFHQVGESIEDDNASSPITVDVAGLGEPPTSPLTGTGTIIGETWVSLAGVPVPQGRTDVSVYRGTTMADAELIATTVSKDNAEYQITGLPADTYIVVGETWIDGVRYSRTYTNVVVNEDDTAVLIIIMYKG
jgi:uncharacterized repeat protein (TIGR01451 family)